ncbi:hypothetical protein IW262DRAFT_1461080 [Armillaria fumosa]|nr:hypothetical protein IW262DRAFT_1461080 [Armillaria fumosa]
MLTRIARGKNPRIDTDRLLIALGFGLFELGKAGLHLWIVTVVHMVLKDPISLRVYRIVVNGNEFGDYFEAAATSLLYGDRACTHLREENVVVIRSRNMRLLLFGWHGKTAVTWLLFRINKTHTVCTGPLTNPNNHLPELPRMFTTAQQIWLSSVTPEYAAAVGSGQLSMVFPQLIAHWFDQFPIEDEDDDNFFVSQPQLVNNMKCLLVEQIRSFLATATNGVK